MSIFLSRDNNDVLMTDRHPDRKSKFRWAMRLHVQFHLSVLGLACICLALVLPTAAHAGDAPLTVGGRLVIVGDSITQQKLYSRYMETYLTACTPQFNLWIMQLGWSGETAPGFLARMDRDLLSFKPTIITTCYGMNDGGGKPYQEAGGERYRKAMSELLARAKAAGMTVVVGSPGAVDSHTFRRETAPAVYNETLSRLGDITGELAAKNDLPFANVHDAMITAMADAKSVLGETYHVCGGDGVHPASNGHLVMACAFLKALGADGRIGTITVDMKGSASVSDGHKLLSASGGKVEIESSRYPFCFFGDDRQPESTRSILPFVPFNQDLNRFTLIVRNLQADGAKVTWGQVSKTFTRGQVAKGVNLAEEFPDNPFCQAFRKVDEQVAAKQVYETYMIHNFYRTLEFLRSLNDPEISASAEVIRKRLSTRQAELRQAVRAAVVPVRHTLSITPQ